MSKYRFWWDDDNVEHIANHGVEPYEAEEVIDDNPFITKVGQGKYLAYGQSDSGRYLLVVFATKPERRIRVVTARDMTNSERKRFRRRKK